ncbi:hypothetical protein IEO21_04602 [Rhodonia placenta]|uniref:Prokaryotic-type class I peptide chain release factors domain-containing protein n=1 Tax=Rhodonia placenta TaxID=104341 RepID=A0A8H7U2T7_9APHY|nr:hypothetical protein IEO21_04602 [Postia placenta]
MALSPAIRASARAAYRDVLRASAVTFTGDDVVRSAFRAMIRNDVMAPSQPSDSKQLQEKIKLTREIAEVLRKNIVQAVKIEEARDPESFDRFKLNITEHTELGSNDTIRDPQPVVGFPHRSAHLARPILTSSADAAKETPSTQVPRYYSQLKKAHKQRVVPELKEEDLEEAFVRGSGPGGQSINKTENNVQLLHKPTGLRVTCQETRSLSQNRKLARRILLGKLDALYNPGLSKEEVKKALQQERKRRRKKKAKKNKLGSEEEEPDEDD